MTVRSISTHPVHLGLGAKAVPQPPMDGGIQWYEDYEARTAGDGIEGRLVSQFSFDEPWTMWEMHPAGDELVLCTMGTMTLHQEHPDGTVTTLELGPGDYAINPPGVWHTADVEGGATAVFITAGSGTQVRAR
ncbi:cupin domain-containing protein [Blastomonas fulva]|jgi:quercetin dioxygenase-like cupin family protein|uniref:cupin domain-containing protein n=1 Tax=Blastomonas fulva TaxID=1550728 RepID=UPI003D2DE507